MLLRIKIFLKKKLGPLPLLWSRIIIRRSLGPGTPPSGKIGQAILSDSRGGVFFGYHDKTPFSMDESKVLAMLVQVKQTDPGAEGREISLGYFQKDAQGNFGDFELITTTRTWCWQQGCMLQWDPRYPNTRIYFNTLVNDGYGAINYDLEKREVVQELSRTIYALNKIQKQALSLNFSRLGRLRPGYGYSILPDTSLGIPAPHDDGLFLVDIASSNAEMIVSLADLAGQVECDPDDEHYINHATFSPDGATIAFFHIWRLASNGKRKIRFCYYKPDSQVLNVMEDERTPSHYCWRDKDNILATNIDSNGSWRYSMYPLGKPRVDLPINLKQDGHPMYLPGSNSVFVTDTYPDRKHEQHLLLCNLENNSITRMASLYSPYRFRGQVRCDLHPRWDRHGKRICLDTAQSGRREMYLINIAGIE